MESLLSSEAMLSLLTLTAMEVVLGLDNIIFISILSSRLPKELRGKARKIGLSGALIIRLILLSLASWIAKLTTPLFAVAGHDFSGKSLILLFGGLFLLYKSTKEIHEKLEGEEHAQGNDGAVVSFSSIIFQIILLDAVFSIDSVITAVGMASDLLIMVTANIFAMIIMLLAGGYVGDFVEKHPTIKILALSFLMMIGLVLVGEGVGFHIPKGYVYFSMGFSVFVEFINIRIKKKGKPVALHNTPKTSDSDV